MTSEMKRLPEKTPEPAYSVLDALDEGQIEQELRGYAPQEFVYSFFIEGKEVTGLSWVGAKALARWMAVRGHPLDAVEKDVFDAGEAWYADIKMVDKATGLALWGSSRQPKIKRLRSGEEKPNEFARIQAVNKAQRNAILAHVPDKLIARFIKGAIEKGKVKRVSFEEASQARPPVPSPPASQPSPPSPSPGGVEHERGKVMHSKGPITSPGVKQIPLLEGVKALGMVNVDIERRAVSLIPERPISSEDPALLGYLFRKKLDPKAQAKALSYQCVVDEAGRLTAIDVFYSEPVLKATVDELANDFEWALKKAYERLEGGV